MHNCRYCGNAINEDRIKFSHKGGILFTKYFCNNCNSQRYWSSFKGPFTHLISAAALMSGLNISSIFNFFTILQCLVPSVRNIFYSAAKCVHPTIRQFYNNYNQDLINYLTHLENPIDQNVIFCKYINFFIFLCFTL